MFEQKAPAAVAESVRKQWREEGGPVVALLQERQLQTATYAISGDNQGTKVIFSRPGEDVSAADHAGSITDDVSAPKPVRGAWEGWPQGLDTPQEDRKPLEPPAPKHSATSTLAKKEPEQSGASSQVGKKEMEVARVESSESWVVVVGQEGVQVEEQVGEGGAEDPSPGALDVRQVWGERGVAQPGEQGGDRERMEGVGNEGDMEVEDIEEAVLLTSKDGIAKPEDSPVATLSHSSRDQQVTIGKETPLKELAVTPVEELAVTPVEEPAVTTVKEPAVTPVEEPAVTTVKEPAVTPVEEPAVTPVKEPAVTPVEEPAVTTVKEPAVTPVKEPAVTPVKEPAVTPVKEPAVTPVKEPAVTTVKEPAVTPVKEPAVTPVKEPAVTPVEELAVTPVKEPAVTTVKEPAVTPVKEPAVTPVKEPAVTPVKDPVVTPVKESQVFPAMEGPQVVTPTREGLQEAMSKEATSAKTSPAKEEPQETFSTPEGGHLLPQVR